MGQSPAATRAGGLDLVITNAIILDWVGRGGGRMGSGRRIVGIGKAGNSDLGRDGVTKAWRSGRNGGVIG